MKKIIYIAAAAAALAAVSCTRDLEWKNAVDVADQNLTLTFSCGDLATRADGDESTTVDGVNNENRVNRIDFFIFPLNSEGTVDGSTEYVYSGELVPEAQASDNKYTKVITGDAALKLSKIFPDGATKAMVFAVANYYGKEGITVKSWDDIHALEVGDTFTKDAGEGFGTRWPHPMETDHEELFFVMTGEKEIELKTGQYVIDDTVPLKRLASKVTVEFDYSHSVYTDEKGVTWVPENLLTEKPELEEARVYLSNAFCHATLGGPQTRTPLIPDGKSESSIYVPRPDRDIFEYAYDFLADATEGQLHYYYTYPYPAAIDANGDNQPYLKLVLPWYGYKNYGTADEFFYKKKEVYYKVVLPSNSITESNKLYQYKVDVRIIGSDTEVEVTGEEYRVKEWLSNDAISSSVATGRYISLEIPKDTYDMYSDLAEILFVSSGDVEVIVNEIYQLNLSGSAPKKEYFMKDNTVTDSTALLTKKGISAEDIEDWVTIESSTLKISHEMDNRIMVNGQKNNAFDMSPYIFKVTLHLVAAGTDTAFDRTLTITQYPSMYATSVKSNASVFVNGYSYANPAEINNSGNHYAWNNRTNGNNDQRRIGSIQNPSNVNGSGTNNSQHSIIIHPTILDSSLGLVIGEAREATGSSLDYISVTNYKAGRSDDAAKKVVSPGFMIASSYGKTQPMSFDRAKERCASYQENGYPAGRWRIPTQGEIEFLIKLSDYGFIPSLFNARYWQSDGNYYESSGSDSESVYVRCVYDVWYWGEEPVASGDAAKEWLGFRD
ncbi:MAG: hypothetical protein IJP49_06670 [Bacteroidales bacterium]|nr:hypothetical protein [Bacteroidales bacterium]